MKLNAIAILLIALSAAPTMSSKLVCPNSTSGGLVFLRFILELDIGNASCSTNQVDEMIETFQNVLKLENSTISDQSTALITGSLCGTNGNNTHRLLLLTRSYTWSGSVSK